jgi:hypothetical protein
MLDKYDLEARLVCRLLWLEAALGGPENCREEVSPIADANSGVDCCLGRLMAAHRTV